MDAKEKLTELNTLKDGLMDAFNGLSAKAREYLNPLSGKNDGSHDKDSAEIVNAMADAAGRIIELHDKIEAEQEKKGILDYKP